MSLSLKGLVEKVYRAFTVSVGNLVRFSFVGTVHVGPSGGAGEKCFVRAFYVLACFSLSSC